MYSFEPTHDMHLVWEILSHPKLYPHLVDDFSPSSEDLDPKDSDSICWLVAKAEEQLLGVICFLRMNQVLWDIHPVLLPETWWGGRAKQVVSEAIRWVWNNSSCQRIVAHVPKMEHRTNLRFPSQVGMKLYGVNERAFLKGGVLRDLYCYGVSKPQ